MLPQHAVGPATGVAAYAWNPENAVENALK